MARGIGLLTGARRFATVTAVAGLMTWFGICLTYIRFYKGMKAQGMDRKSLPYVSRFQPYTAYYGASVSLFVSIVRRLPVFLPTPHLSL